MNIYVAFLRGINVGGNNIIKMVDLKKAFEDMKFSAVKTYIQSGNVLFQSKITDKRKIEQIIEKKLSTTFSYNARVIVYSKEEMNTILKSFPKIFSDDTWKHNVMFLTHIIDKKEIASAFQIKKDIEQITYAKGVLFWSVKMSDLTRSTLMRLPTKKEYKEMSVRNINTTRKIVELMSEYD